MDENANPLKQDQNPLTGYFRKPEVYVSLPSKGNYYAPGAIDFPQNGEIGVFPMTAKDELVFKTPDALLNGSSTVEVIKSCVPAIKDPWSIPSLDMDVILIAIRIATYGNQMDINATCPTCQAQNEFGIDLAHLIDQSGKWLFNDTLQVGDLTIKFRPLSYKDLNTENLRQFEEAKIMRIVNDETTTDEQKQQLFNDTFLKLTVHTVDLIAKTIFKIITADGTEVTNTKHINEFVHGVDRKMFDTIQQHLDNERVNNSFAEFELTCENEGCGTKYNTPIVFDNSNFFA